LNQTNNSITNTSDSRAFLVIQDKTVLLKFVIHPKARRYVLRMRPDGSGRVTIPRRGSMTEARKFAELNQAWIEKQLARMASQSSRPSDWAIGTELFFRGEQLAIQANLEDSNFITIGPEKIKAVPGQVRVSVENHLWNLARRELTPRVVEFAQLHQLNLGRVTVRNQRSRWGSCSRRGTISLNWRLIQTPRFVQDYIILHELMHLREMNHSPRFWREVERVCPGYLEAEKWLKQHSKIIIRGG
jgi:predicted metal-dependent hydrolase